MTGTRHRASPPPRLRPALLGAAALALVLVLSACGSRAGTESQTTPGSASGYTPTPDESVFIDSLEARTFRFFWDLSNPETGLTPDRAPSKSFASVSATGFALTAYPIGVERGWVSREAAAERVRNTLRFFWTAPQDTTRSGATGYRGFFYHFLDADSGTRFADVELSTVDTALFLAGALFCASYFTGPGPGEAEIRALADSLYFRADWTWAQVRPPAIGHGWDPENGFLPYDWKGYNEAMIVYLLALGSPTHPVAPEAWDAWTSTYRWGTFKGYTYLGFAPLFGHQYTQVWFDFRGIRDAAMREHDLDYFENSRRATLAQRAYALENPGGWTGYGEGLWGLSACDGPVNGSYAVGGAEREFHTYWARGACFTRVGDDGTVTPTAAGGSIAFAPEAVVPLLVALRDGFGENLYSTYGFLDALNPTYTLDVPPQHGRVDPQLGWFDTDYLGIDQGPILAMIENWRSDLVWRVMRTNPHVIRGLRRAGFTGGWLDAAGDGR